MEEIAVAYRADLAVAEAAAQTHGTEVLLDEAGVVAGLAEEAPAAAVAATETAAVNRRARQVPARVEQQLIEFLTRRGRVAALELDGLAGARQRAHGEDARMRIGPQQVADEEVAALELLPVFVGDQAYEEVALDSALLGRGSAWIVSASTS